MDEPDLRIAPTSLRELWRASAVEVEHDVLVTGLVVDSTDVQPGMVFAALPGQHTHGARFARQALERGAAAVLTDGEGAALLDANPPVVVVDDPRARLGELSAAVYGRPADQLTTFGVTGTNGKTTTTWLLEAGLAAAGRRPGLFGTVGIRFDGRTFATSRTTPEAPYLHALLAHLLRLGADSVALEVSSHALALGRVDGLVVDVAGFTNLGHDHLDFHGSMAAYEAAKQLLFTPAHAQRGIVVVDGEAGRRVADAADIPVDRVRSRRSHHGDELGPVPWQVRDPQPQLPTGWRFGLARDDAPAVDLRILLSGQFNVANAALAAAMLLTAGVDAEAVAAGLRHCRGVPGRMEVVDRGQPFSALVDYAHTTDALSAVLTGLRAQTSGRLLVVFGCGGDRDTDKRPEMGAAAAALADVVVVTDDNPRTEDPAAVRAAVLSGARRDRTRAVVLEVGDRGAAIAAAVAMCLPGDTLVVAGKGHEQGQQVGDVMLPFDDRSALAAALDAEGKPLS